MNWITNYVRPRINSLFSRREMPENLWTKCDECGTMLFHRELSRQPERLHQLRPSHGDHAARPVHRAVRRRHLHRGRRCPSRSPTRCISATRSAIPTGCAPRRRPPARRRRCWSPRARSAARPIVAAAQDFSLHGRLDGHVCRQRHHRRRRRRRCELKRPLILFSAAGGARMQEGILSLMQMPRTTVAVQMLKEAGLPYIVVLTHPTTGGVTASYAMLGDVQIAEPNALICFAGPRVIEQTIREKLPEGFQRAEYLLDHGMLDRVTAPQRSMRDELITITRMLMRPAARGEGRPARAREDGDRPMPPAEPRRRRARPAAEQTRQEMSAPTLRRHPRTDDGAAPQDHRPDAGPRLAPAGRRSAIRERALPPVIHIAGTNGKGSTQAMIRAGLEARGQTRPRLYLAASRAVPRAHPPGRRADLRGPRCRTCWTNATPPTATRPITYFEITTCAALLAFAAHPGRLHPARGRAWRAAGRDQRGRRAGADDHHAGLDRPPAISGRHAGRDRGRKGRHPEARRALRRRPAGTRPRWR